MLDLINTLSSYGDFAKLKKECYEDLKMSLDEAQNLKIKNSVFANIKFDSFENFITSIAGELNSLLQVKNRMILPSDLTLYFKLFSFEELNSKYIYPLTDDLNSLVGSMKSDNEMNIIFTLWFTILNAIFDEYHQLFVSGHEGGVIDLCKDIAGIVFVLLWIRVIFSISLKVRGKKEIRYT